MNMNELLDQAKTRANLSSDYALSKATGISQQILSGIRKGRRHPSNEEAVKLAALAGLPEMKVIAEIELLTANSEKKKEFWKHYIESRGIAACLTMTALAASIVLAPEPTEASVLHLTNYDGFSHAHNADGIYIMRISGRGKAERFAA